MIPTAPATTSRASRAVPPSAHVIGDDDVILRFEPAAEVTCVCTRFQLHHPLQLALTYLDYRRLTRRLRGTQGLLKSVFLVESACTCWTISVWESPSSIPRFGTAIPEHVDAARRVFGRVEKRLGRPLVWSTKWRLSYLSNNQNWPGLDLYAIAVAPKVGSKANGRA